MIAEDGPRCALGLTSRTLSTWRAQGVSATEAERISAHVSSCAACQRQLAAYDAMDAVLRAQPVLAPPASDWDELCERIEDEPVRTPLHWPIPAALRRSSKGLIAIAAALLVVVAFTWVLGRGAFGPAAPPTLTPITLAPQPGGRITGATWQHVTTPVPQGWYSYYTTAPNDPATVYVCGTPPVLNAPESLEPGQPNPGQPDTIVLWLTHDAGQHWTKAPLPEIKGWGCYVQVASDTPQHIAVLVDLGPGPNTDTHCTNYSLVLSADGGATWQTAPTVYSPISQLVYICSHFVWITARHVFLTTSYSIVQTTPGSGFSTVGGGAIARSDDGGRTWARVQFPDQSGMPTLLADGETIIASGADTANPKSGNSVLWQSRDAGDNWQRMAILEQSGAYEILTAPGVHTAEPSVAHPLYLANGLAIPWYLFRIQVAQVTNSQHYAPLPPLPVPGTSSERLGITTILGETPDGKLLALGIGPDDSLPAPDQPVSMTQFSQQWLWEWDPRLDRWSAFTTPLPLPWSQSSTPFPGCSDHCWLSYIAVGQGTAGAYLWVRTIGSALYRMRLPGA
ncbi:MAG: hypothetical protein OJF49_003324 [Ktedonobacterales bacterium]|jgi:hypothetical protein|nr:MAG: hypothetical protein OJF49_003324 [Ktedonobacterales bacterium]